jgi:hypothetical protein
MHFFLPCVGTWSDLDLFTEITMQWITSQQIFRYARFSKIPVTFRNRGSSVGIVTRQNVIPSVCGSIRGGGNGVSSFQRFQTDSEFSSISGPVGTVREFPGNNVVCRDVKLISCLRIVQKLKMNGILRS